MASSLSALLERSGNPAIGADESLRLALGVKIDTKKKNIIRDLPFGRNI